MTANNNQCMDIDNCFVLAIFRVKMRRRMVVEDILTTMPKNRLISGIRQQLAQSGKQKDVSL